MITLDLTPIEETQLFTVAKKIGLAPAEYIKKMVKEHLPQTETELRAVKDPFIHSAPHIT